MKPFPRTFDKRALRETLRNVEDDQALSQALENATQANVSIRQLHAHEEHARVLESLPFVTNTNVGPGAIVELGGRHFFVGIPTPVFAFSGVEMMGVSLESPLVRAMLGLSTGDIFAVNGRDHAIGGVW